MHVRDLHAAVRAGVEDRPEAGLDDALRSRDLADRRDQRTRRSGIGAQLDHAVEMLLRDHEHVDAGLRPDVPEGQHGVGLVHHGRGDLARHDPAEQAIGHVAHLNGCRYRAGGSHSAPNDWALFGQLSRKLH